MKISMITLSKACYKSRFLLITNPGYNKQLDLVLFSFFITEIHCITFIGRPVGCLTRVSLTIQIEEVFLTAIKSELVQLELHLTNY